MDRVRVFWMVLFCVLFLPKQVFAAGLFLTNGYTQIAPAEDRALLVFDGKTETMVTSATFTLNPLVVWDFAYLIAVPEKPTVEIVNTDTFAMLDQKTHSVRSTSFPFTSVLFPDIIYQQQIRPSSFSRPAYLNDYQIFSPPDQLVQLLSWSAKKGYILPKSAIPLLTKYVQKNWSFVLVEISGTHIQMSAADSLLVHAAHTLPVKISFPATTLIYPTMLASIQPDEDSQSVPLSYAYQTPSETVLGTQDPDADRLLSTPSANKYPTLPLDLTNLKIDLFVLTNHKITSDLLQTTYANRLALTFVDDKGKSYLPPVSEQMILTRLTGYIPLIQLSDIVLIPASDNYRVNVAMSWKEILARLVLTVIFLSGVLGFIYKKYIQKR